MAAKFIETKAIISASDRTGGVFSSVAQKMRTMEAAAAATSKRMDSVAKGMSAVWQNELRHRDIAAKMSSISPIASGGGLFAMSAAQRERALQTAMQTGAAIAAQAPIVREITRQASARIHEQIRMGNAGMTPTEIAEANEEASRLAREYKPIAQNDILHMLRNMRSVVGSYTEAAEIAKPLMDLRVITQHARPHASAEEINEDFDKLIKAAELSGVTQNLSKFGNYIEGISKAVNVFGDTIKPYQYFEAAQYARSATSQLSPEFVAGVLPTLIQHHGGSQAGTALSAFYRAIVGGKMSNVAMSEMLELGLVDPSKVIKTKTGAVHGVKPGGIYGSDLARSDPDRWVHEYLEKALQRRKIVDPGRIAEIVAHLFSNQVAAQFVTEMMTQRALFDKDRELTRNAKGRSAAQTIMSQDFDQAVLGLKNEFNSLAAVLGKDVTPRFAALTNWTSEKLGDLNKRLEGDPKARTQALIGGGIASLLGAHLSMAGIGSYFGGPGVGAALGGMARFLGPAALAADTAAFGYKMWQNYSKMLGMLDVGDAMMKAPAPFIDRSPAAIAQRRALRQLIQPVEWGAGMGFGSTAWARGPAVTSVAPGSSGFGFGPAGVGDIKTLSAPPQHLAAALAAAMRSVPPQPVKIEGSAAIDVKVKVEADRDSVVREVTQNVVARGALRSDTGVSMAPGY